MYRPRLWNSFFNSIYRGYILLSGNAENLGTSISIGDVNGDGLGDMLLAASSGTFGNAAAAGTYYVVYGQTDLSTLPPYLCCNALTPSIGYSLSGVNNGDDYFNYITSGDINGDGIKDVVIGAPSAPYITTIPTGPGAGQVYTLYGHASPYYGGVQLGNLGCDGFTLDGINYCPSGGAAMSDATGTSVSAADVNGDGIDDLIIGAPNAPCTLSRGAGAVYVFYGTRSYMSQIPINLNTLNGTNGFTITGEPGTNGGDGTGVSVSSGDINGDGIKDILIGAYQDPVLPTGIGPGKVYVIYGSRQPFPANYSVANINGTNGFTITGIGDQVLTGQTVINGDLNHDGIADIIISAPLTYDYFRCNTPTGAPIIAGQVYVVFGSRTPFPANFLLTSLNGQNGFVLNSYERGQFGYSLAVGDINGDKMADLVIGDPSANCCGRAYVLYCGPNIGQFAGGYSSGSNPNSPATSFATRDTPSTLLLFTCVALLLFNNRAAYPRMIMNLWQGLTSSGNRSQQPKAASESATNSDDSTVVELSTTPNASLTSKVKSSIFASLSWSRFFPAEKPATAAHEEPVKPTVSTSYSNSGCCVS